MVGCVHVVCSVGAYATTTVVAIVPSNCMDSSLSSIPSTGAHARRARAAWGCNSAPTPRRRWLLCPDHMNSHPLSGSHCLP